MRFHPEIAHGYRCSLEATQTACEAEELGKRLACALLKVAIDRRWGLRLSWSDTPLPCRVVDRTASRGCTMQAFGSVTGHLALSDFATALQDSFGKLAKAPYRLLLSMELSASAEFELANHYQDWSQRLNRVRSRMYLPTLFLLVVLLAQPLPALVTGTLSGGHYLLRLFGVLTVIAPGGLAVTYLSGWLEKSGLKTLWDGVLLRLPWAGDWRRVRQLNELFFMLGLLLDAGLTFSDALPRSVATIRNRVLRAQFAPAVARCGSGASAVAVLGEVAVIRPPALQILASGERSGRLAETMLHFARSEAHAIALQDEAFAEWLPRLVYGGIGGWIAHSILTGGIFLPHP